MKKVFVDCQKCIFKKNCLSSFLTPLQRKKWNRIKESAACSDKDFVYQEGETSKGIMMVCKGRVKIYLKDMYNQQMIIWIKHPGDMFGHICFFSGEEFLGNAECMGNTIISVIKEKDLKTFLSEDVYKLLLNRISLDMRKIFYKLKDTAYLPAKNKIAQTLLNYISYKTRNSLTPTIYGLKRTEIAEITGLALETVVRTLASFEKKGLIKRELRSIKILDLERMNKLANLQRI